MTRTRLEAWWSGLAIGVHLSNQFFQHGYLRSLVDHSSLMLGSALRGPARKRTYLSVAFVVRDAPAVPLRASLGWASHL